jgi:hypothetical protein
MKKDLRRFITDVGAALPTAELKHLGTIALKRGSGAVAEWHGVGQDAAGAARWDRLLDKIYADTLYSTAAHAHDSTYVNVTGDTMTGGLTIQGDHVTPPALLIEKADGTDLLRMYSNLAQGTLRLLAASDFQMYSTAETTQGFAIDGATGHIQRLGIVDVTIAAGAGSPEGVLTAPIGSLWLRTNGSTNAAVYRKETGAGNTGWVAISSRFNAAPQRFPVGNIQDTAAAATSFVSNSSYAAYMGRADGAYTTVNLRVQVDTGAGTITWAEVGVGTSPQITLGSGASITRRGSTDVSASFNTTGDKTVSVTTTGIDIGDHLWALFGSQATTPYQLRAVAAESTDAGTDQSVAATRISTMASPTSFGISAVRLGCGFWIGT